MKKIIISFILVFLVLGLTGCSKKLTCTADFTEDEDGVDMTATAIVTFVNDESTEVTLKSTFADEDIASIYYSYLEDAEADYVLNGATISITQEIEDDEKLSYEEAKTQFEEQGYVCK
ncbi:MAG TPA: hypothetical protein PLX66_01035 [Bacilli bacterium]|nr:hypothetical protein [Bacilli bacterium]